MAEVEDLCDRVAIVGSGRVVYEGALDELIASAAGRYELRTTDDGTPRRSPRATATSPRSPAGSSFAGDERAAAALSLALGAGRHRHPRARPAHGHARGAVLPMTEGAVA